MTPRRPAAVTANLLTEGLHHCPAHPDRRPSLSVARGPDGRWLLHDYAGCATEAILRAAGLTFADLFPSDSGRSARPARPAPRRHWRDELERPLLARARRAAARLAPFREVFALSDEIRERRRDVVQLRRIASAWGDTEATWDVLAVAAEEERAVDLIEMGVDAAMRGMR